MLLLCISNPLVDICRNFSEKVSALLLSRLSVLFQLRDFTGAQAAQFILDCRDVIPCLMNLADDANQLSPDPFALHRFSRVPKLIENSLESLGVALAVRHVCLSHQAGAE
jgi:hypothetical protein